MVRRGPKGSVLYAESEEHTRNGHDWNPMSDMELESLRGVRIVGRGVRKKGGSDEPPKPPPGYGPDILGKQDIQSKAMRGNGVQPISIAVKV